MLASCPSQRSPRSRLSWRRATALRGFATWTIFISRASIELVAVDAEQGTLARHAFSRFGKGRHRAGLNYGDCFSYALAVATGEALLFKGKNFVHTDVGVVGPHANNDAAAG